MLKQTLFAQVARMHTNESCTTSNSVSDVDGLYFHKRFKGSGHPFYDKVYKKAAKIDKLLADNMVSIPVRIHYVIIIVSSALMAVVLLFVRTYLGHMHYQIRQSSGCQGGKK